MTITTGIYLEGVHFSFRRGSSRRPFELRCPFLSVLPGQFACLVGANASGKTTLLRLCRGDLKPFAGRVLIDNIDASDNRSHRRLRQVLVSIDAAARDALVDELLVLDHLVAALTIARRVDHLFPRSHRMIALVASVLEKEGLDALTPILLSRVGTLNAGHRQLVALAVALLHDRPIMLADETTANLDVSNAAMFFREVQSRTRTHDRAALLVTHDLFLAGRFADLIYVIVGGVVRPVDIADNTGESRTDAIARLVLGGQEAISASARDPIRTQ